MSLSPSPRMASLEIARRRAATSRGTEAGQRILTAAGSMFFLK
jgi:hypothetical protein